VAERALARKAALAVEHIRAYVQCEYCTTTFYIPGLRVHYNTTIIVQRWSYLLCCISVLMVCLLATGTTPSSQNPWPVCSLTPSNYQPSSVYNVGRSKRIAAKSF
jgi:hypothetical protein